MRVVKCSTCTEDQIIRRLESIGKACFEVIRCEAIQIHHQCTIIVAFTKARYYALFRSVHPRTLMQHRFHTTAPIKLSLPNPRRCRTSRPILHQSSAWEPQQARVEGARSRGWHGSIRQILLVAEGLPVWREFSQGWHGSSRQNHHRLAQAEVLGLVEA